MLKLPNFTNLTRQFISIRERSGSLTSMCESVAEHYGQEIRHTTRNLGTMIEPIMISALGMVALFLALAIFLPMWDMASVTTGGES